MPNTINIFCIVANNNSADRYYITELLNDKKFVSRAKLERVVCSTTRPMLPRESETDFHFVTMEEYENMPDKDIIEFRSYYSLKFGTVYYFTERSQFVGKNHNLICHASPFQYEAYRRWISTENILKPDSYSVNLISINTKLRKVMMDKVQGETSEDNIMEFCRMIIQEDTEYSQAAKRIPELMEPTLCNNVCYIDNNFVTEDDLEANLDKIMAFILKVLNNA